MSIYYELAYQQLHQLITKFTAYLNFMKNNLKYDDQQKMSHLLIKMHSVLIQEIKKQ